MTARNRPPMVRGSLPARVYWRRRLAVLGVALLLVLGVARLLGAGSDGSSGGDTASLADAPASTTDSPTASGPVGPAGSIGPTAPATTPTTDPTPVLATPDGPCADGDIAVTPEVTAAVAGPRNGVAIDLQLRTISDEACTWTVSPRTLTLKITSGKDDIWSSRECPRVLPRQEVTVRRAVSTTLSVAWNAKRSDEDCSKVTEWALPGWYHVSAAALAGEPSEVQFELLAPQPAVVTRTAEPTQDADGSGQAGKKNEKTRKNKPNDTTPTEEPPASGEPSGAVEPDLG